MFNKISKWSSEAIDFSKCHKDKAEKCRIMRVRGLRWGSCMLTGSLQWFPPLWISQSQAISARGRTLPCGLASIMHRKQCNNKGSEHECAYLHHAELLDFVQLHSCPKIYSCFFSFCTCHPLRVRQWLSLVQWFNLSLPLTPFLKRDLR